MSKLIEGTRSAAVLIASVAGAITIGYGVIVKAGWVIGRAEAQDMITIAVQSAAAETNQALLDEVKDRRKADLQQQIDLTNQKILSLMNVAQRSEAQNFELDQLAKQLDRLNADLAGIK